MAGLKVEQPVVGKGWAAILTCAPIYSHCNSWAPIGQSVSQTKTRCILVQCNEQGDIVITIGTAIFIMKMQSAIRVLGRMRVRQPVGYQLSEISKNLI